MTVSRIGVTTGAPAGTASFTPTLPTHASGDRLILAALGKYDTTTVPTIDQGWTLVNSGTGGTGATGNDLGPVFWAIYAKDATSSSETAPTVTAGATAPNSWVWICATHRPDTGMTWADSIGASVAWVQSASDTDTATPLTGTCGAWTGVQPTTGDAILGLGTFPTNSGSTLASATITATGLSGGTKDTATTQYVETTLNANHAAVWVGWVDFTGTASAGLDLSYGLNPATNQSGAVLGVALRETSAELPLVPTSHFVTSGLQLWG